MLRKVILPFVDTPVVPTVPKLSQKRIKQNLYIIDRLALETPRALAEIALPGSDFLQHPSNLTFNLNHQA
jgi:hypothetical protein